MTPQLPIQLPGQAFAIRTNGLSKTYGANVALRHLDLQVPVGGLYVLVGPNGAGKTTTVRILLNALRPDSGDAEVAGVSAETDPVTARANIGYVPELGNWGHSWMRVGALLAHHSRYYSTWDETYAQRLIAAFELPPRQRVSTLSKGQARRLHWVMALCHRPPVLVLDEPTDGLDPLMRHHTLEVLKAHMQETPTAVLFATHHVAEIEDLATHVGVMSVGQLKVQTTIQRMRTSLQRYVGRRHGSGPLPVVDDCCVIGDRSHGEKFDSIIWGEEPAVVTSLAMIGVEVGEVSSLSLQDATLAIVHAFEEAT